MAEGGYDPERIDTSEMQETLEADIANRNVEFRNPVYEEEEDEEINTSTRSNLSTDDQFDLGRAPNPELTKKQIRFAEQLDAVIKFLKFNNKKLTTDGEAAVRTGWNS